LTETPQQPELAGSTEIVGLELTPLSPFADTLVSLKGLDVSAWFAFLQSAAKGAECHRVKPSVRRYERVPAIDRVQARINEQIRISPVRVISSTGAQLGVMPTIEAVRLARDEGYDLVEVAPQARPPVCRIMDYGKYKYEKGKKSAKGKSHQTKLKEIRVRPKTGQHDIDFKVKQAVTFLQHKDKVQVTVLFRGRELAHVEEGRKVMNQILSQLTEIGKIESQPSTQAKRMMCTVAPR